MRSDPFFFIVGSQRSGTTLLRLLLNSHTDIAVPTEATFLMPLLNKQLLKQKPLTDDQKNTLLKYLTGNSQFKKWGLADENVREIIHNNSFLKNIISDLYRSFSAKYNKPLVGDKSPTFIRKLGIFSKAFPSAKFIYIIRDGRDTFLSLKAKNAPGSQSLALGAIEWRIKQALIEKKLSLIPHRVHTLRYEDLLKNTEKELIRVCRFLNIDYQPDMLQFWQKSDDFIAQHHSELISKPIDPSNVFKWKKILTGRENAIYSCFARRYLKKNDYEVSGKRLPLSIFLKCVFGIGYHLPKRLFRIFRIAVVMRLASKLGKNVDQKYYD